jgi:hypothetical protein
MHSIQIFGGISSQTRVDRTFFLVVLWSTRLRVTPRVRIRARGHAATHAPRCPGPTQARTARGRVALGCVPPDAREPRLQTPCPGHLCASHVGSGRRPLRRATLPPVVIQAPLLPWLSLRLEEYLAGLYKRFTPSAQSRGPSISLNAIRHGRCHDELPAPGHPRPNRARKPHLDPVAQLPVPHIALPEPPPCRDAARGGHRRRAPSPAPPPPRPRPQSEPRRPPRRLRRLPASHGHRPRRNCAGCAAHIPEDPIAKIKIFLGAKLQSKSIYVKL